MLSVWAQHLGGSPRAAALCSHISMRRSTRRRRCGPRNYRMATRAQRSSRALQTERTQGDMAEALLLPYLLLLLLLPLAAQWRWGAIGSLTATVVGLGLVALVFYLLEAHRAFPNPYPVGQTLGSESPMVQLRRNQGYGATILVLWVILPACAV